MDSYAPPPCYAHCACCAHRPTTRESPRGLFFVPLQMGLLIEENDYELEPLYLHPYQYFPRLRRSPRWCRRGKEEEEEEEAIKSRPTHFFYDENNPRKKKIDAHKNSQEEYLQTLAHRLEALELGLERLTTVRNPQKPRPQRIGRERVARSNPPTDDCPRPQDPPRSEKFSKKESFVMKTPEDAALIIQSSFRAYLVRRSETLRHLRDLAIVKSTLKKLHCLYADSRYRRLLCRDADERNRFSERATALLLKVDSVQGCDSMVREARRALSKDLVRLLDSLDGMGAQCMQRRKPGLDKEDILMPERAMMPSGCIECSGEMAIPVTENEEEEMEEMRAPPSDRRYFPRPVCKINRGRHSHRSSDFDANTKMRIPFKFRKNYGSSGHLQIAGIDDMDELGFEIYCPSTALPF